MGLTFVGFVQSIRVSMRTFLCTGIVKYTCLDRGTLSRGLATNIELTTTEALPGTRLIGILGKGVSLTQGTPSMSLHPRYVAGRPMYTR